MRLKVFSWKLFVDLVFKVVGWLWPSRFARMPVESSASAQMRTATRRSGLTITPRENAAGFALAERRRRVLENTREKKQGLDPERSQFRNAEFVGRDRSFDQQRDRRMIEITGGDERDRA